MTVRTLLYGCETWVPTQRDVSRIQAEEMRFLGRVKGCTKTDRFRNEEELHVEALIHKITEYRGKWLERLLRMDNTTLPKIAYNYSPTGRPDFGRQRKRWRDL